MKRQLAVLLATVMVASLAPATVLGDTPTTSAGPITILEDAGASTITLSADDPNVVGIDHFTILTGPGGPGQGQVGAVSAVVCPAPGDPCTATVTYTPDADANGTDSFQFTATDATPETSMPATASITIEEVNDAPSFTKGPDQTVAEDSGAQSMAGWATSLAKGPSNESAQTLTLHLAPANPALFSAGPSVNVTNGDLSFTPATNANGSTNVDVYVQDSGGTANSGDDMSATQTFTITITPVNDNPTAVDDTATVLEDSGANSVNVLANDTFAPDTGETLEVTLVSDPPKGSAQITGGGTGVSYDPDTNATGSDSFTYTISDGNGGTDTGTVDVTITPSNDPPTALNDTATILEDSGSNTIAVLANDSIAPDTGETLAVTTVGVATKGTAAVGPVGANVTYTPVANANGSDSFTYTVSDGNDGTDIGTVDVTITAVNDEPSFTILGDQAVPEDAGPTTVAAFGSASTGPPDESAQAVTYVVTNDNNSLFSAQPAIAANGTLTFTPTAAASGSAIVTVHVTDNGGVADGGDNTSPDQTFTITVAVVNDPPTLTIGASQVDLEDAGAQTVASFATKSPGPSSESGQTTAFHVSNDNNALFSAQPAIAANGTLSYTPAADANGVATVSVYVTDNGGTDNGGDDTSATQQFTITITPVNDAPSFTKGADQTVLEDAGTQNVAGWATSLSTGGGADEAGQALGFEFTANSNAALFSNGPAVGAAGNLTYTLAADANGSATLSVLIRDDGGVASGGVAASSTQSFTITVAPVNDAPSFTKGDDVPASEDAPAQIVMGWAKGVVAGPADEAGQVLKFAVTDNTNTDLFTVAPAIAANGSLTFTPKANRSGTATITTQLQDDGGVVNGGADTSAPQSFDITVGGENDAPIARPDVVTVRLGGSQAVSILANDVGGPGEPGDPVHVVSVEEGSRGIVTVNAAGTAVTYDPVGCTTGSDVFRYTIQDAAGLPSVTQDVFVTITGPSSYPLADGPRPSFVSGSTIGSTVPVKLSWCGITSGTTIDSYRLYQSINDRPYTTKVDKTTATSSTRSVSFSPTRHQFQVRVKDRKSRYAWGTGPDFRVGRVQETSAAIAYSSGWTKATNRKHSGTTVRGTSTSGKSATFTYTGRGFAIVGPRSSKRGKFKVYVDGAYRATVSERASSTQYRRVLYAATLTQGKHAIRIVAAGGGRIDLDAFLTLTGY